MLCIVIITETVKESFVHYDTLVIVNCQCSDNFAGCEFRRWNLFEPVIPNCLVQFEFSFQFFSNKENLIAFMSHFGIGHISVIADDKSFISTIHLNHRQFGELLLAVVDLEGEVLAGDVFV